jgi:hypothetical protein
MKYIFLVGLIFLTAISSFSQKSVLLDTYFNNEYKVDQATGQKVPYHYRWEETAISGFSILSDIFKSNGMRLASLPMAPTADNLKGHQIYIIVDPDTKKETPNPNFIDQTSVKHIADWVKKGGVLVLFANDSANTELPHFNTLANTFGINFNNTLINHVTNDVTREGGGIVTTGSTPFKTAKLVYMKDACSISISGSAFPILKQKDDIIIAGSTYGKGTVVAIGDPWLYNEYVNGKLQKEFENDKGADDLVKWLISKTK